MTQIPATGPANHPPVVLLHSLLADAGSWGPLVRRLTGAARLIVADLPGFGDTPPVSGGLEAIAATVADTIRAQCPDTAPAVVGNGFGGFVALRLALDHPELVSRLVLIGSGARFSDAGRAAFAAMRMRAAEAGLAAIADTAMARLFQPEFSVRHPDLLAQRRDAFLRTDPGMFAQACAALEAFDLTEDAWRITCPTLILAGAEDQATPRAMAGVLAGLLPYARCVVLSGLAHVPQLQDPEQISRRVAGFLGLAVDGAA